MAERFTGRLDGMNERGLCIGLHCLRAVGARASDPHGANANPVHGDLDARSAGTPLGFDRLQGRLGGGTETAKPRRRPASGQRQDRSFENADLAGASFSNVSLAGARFTDVGLAGASFTDVSLASARFDDIDFADAEITANCNFRGMRIGGVPVEELFAAYRDKRSPEKAD